MWKWFFVVLCWRANLSMVKELGDKAAQGRTYGNLGNTYYLLGEFETAVAAHEKVGSRPLKKSFQFLLQVSFFKPAFISLFLLPKINYFCWYWIHSKICTLFYLQFICSQTFYLSSDVMIVKAVMINAECFQLILYFRVVMYTLLFVLIGSVSSSPKSLEISQLRGGLTVTLAMLTYSSASLRWRLVITSE